MSTIVSRADSRRSDPLECQDCGASLQIADFSWRAPSFGTPQGHDSTLEICHPTRGPR
jgi:hypothetical protein